MYGNIVIKIRVCDIDVRPFVKLSFHQLYVSEHLKASKNI